MAKEKLTFTLTLDYDPDEHNGMPARNFLYHFLTRFNNTEVKVAEVGYKGGKFNTTGKAIEDIPLKKVDSVSATALPKAPKWLKDRTEIDPATNENVARRMKEGKEIIRT